MSIFNNLLAGTKFVFCTNSKGEHSKVNKSSVLASKYYHAREGVIEGITGDSYALPVLDVDNKSLPFTEIQWFVDNFLHFANSEKSYLFQVSRFDFEQLGYTEENIASLFSKAPENVYIPSYWDYLLKKQDFAKLLVIGDSVNEELINNTLSQNTRGWNKKFEVVTSCENDFSKIISKWTRNNELAWTPFPEDVKRFSDYSKIIHQHQLSWYCTHVLVFSKNIEKYSDLISFFKKENIKVKSILI